MKCIWTKEDVEPGRFVHKFKPGVNLNTMEPGEKADRVYIVSYGYNETHEQVYYLTAMTDGMQVGRKRSLDELAAFMNEGDYMPMSGADKDSILAKMAAVATRIR